MEISIEDIDVLKMVAPEDSSKFPNSKWYFADPLAIAVNIPISSFLIFWCLKNSSVANYNNGRME